MSQSKTDGDDPFPEPDLSKFHDADAAPLAPFPKEELEAIAKRWSVWGSWELNTDGATLLRQAISSYEALQSENAALRMDVSHAEYQRDALHDALVEYQNRENTPDPIPPHAVSHET